MSYYTQQLFSGTRDRILRVVDAQSERTAGFIHLFDERRAFDFAYAKELTNDKITEEEFEAAGPAANTFSASFMQIGEDKDEVVQEWGALIGREYALVPNVRINMYRQTLKPEIEEITDKEGFEARLLELITRILGSSVLGFDEKELTLYPSFLLQEQLPQPKVDKTPGVQITLPD
jgi:hypothetical protein